MGSKSTALWTVFRVSRTSSQCKQIRCLWHIKDWIVWIVGLVPTFWSIVPAFIRIISYLVILVGSELAVLAASHWLATASAAQVVLHPFTFDCADVPTGVTSVTMARCMRSLAELWGSHIFSQADGGKTQRRATHCGNMCKRIKCAGN